LPFELLINFTQACP